MTMPTESFSASYVPPAPVLPVQLALPEQSPGAESYPALVDTGADGTFVPTAILEKLAAPIAYMTNARAHLGDVLFRVPVHDVDLILFGSIRLPGVEVVGDDWRDRIILGRNVLNRLRLELDGPALECSFA